MITGYVTLGTSVYNGRYSDNPFSYSTPLNSNRATTKTSHTAPHDLYRGNSNCPVYAGRVSSQAQGARRP